jgi:hypothetical protein
MGRECSTHGGVHIRFLWESQKEGNRQENLDLSVRIILKSMLEK